MFCTPRLYCKEKVSRGKNGVSIYYELRAKIDDKDKKLLGGIQNSSEVQYLEQEIEKYFKIGDIKVAGEFSS